ncbi:MAG: sel1 repeat family protein [Nitrospirae bacterium]|nr:sel1 repeat family protein [Nitrospirota bacterium]
MDKYTLSADDVYNESLKNYFLQNNMHFISNLQDGLRIVFGINRDFNKVKILFKEACKYDCDYKDKGAISSEMQLKILLIILGAVSFASALDKSICETIFEKGIKCGQYFIAASNTSFDVRITFFQILYQSISMYEKTLGNIDKTLKNLDLGKKHGNELITKMESGAGCRVRLLRMYYATHKLCLDEALYLKALELCNEVFDYINSYSKFNKATSNDEVDIISHIKESKAFLDKMPNEARTTPLKLAFFVSGIGFLYGSETIEKNYDKALYFFKKASDLNNVDADFFLGIMYEEGHGVGKDLSIAKDYYKRAAEGNNIEAQYYLSRLILSGDYCKTQEDVLEAFYWLVLSSLHKNKNATEYLNKLRRIDKSIEEGLQEIKQRICESNPELLVEENIPEKKVSFMTAIRNKLCKYI